MDDEETYGLQRSHVDWLDRVISILGLSVVWITLLVFFWWWRASI